ncbi:hypothetical protein Cni_G22091 [Canna indica]|uniref:Glycosyl transferase CAP10 domain-containing protein n=1 Tax=Canna indica TaxID=4628 RepID=A0AAQ3QLC2_9LILI|nr:hypothetical protein Cni_G22091 [Canna indica]
MGKASSDFFQEEVKMDFVYDYMLHVLTEYAKLLRYKPTLPEKAKEFCLESMACSAPGDVKKFLLESMEKSTHDQEPCTLPPPYTPEELQQLHENRANAIKQKSKHKQESDTRKRYFFSRPLYSAQKLNATKCQNHNTPSSPTLVVQPEVRARHMFAVRPKVRARHMIAVRHASRARQASRGRRMIRVQHIIFKS